MSWVHFRKLILQFCQERSIGNIVGKPLRSTFGTTREILLEIQQLGDVSEMNLRVVSGEVRSGQGIKQTIKLFLANYHFLVMNKVLFLQFDAVIFINS